MPCRDYEPESAVDDMRERLNKVTALLCAVLHTIEDHDTESTARSVVKSLNKIDGLDVWWAEHKEADRRRRKAEKEKQKQDEMRKRIAFKKVGRELGIDVRPLLKQKQKARKYYIPDEGEEISAIHPLTGKRGVAVVREEVAMKGVDPYHRGWQVRFHKDNKDVQITVDAEIQEV